MYIRRYRICDWTDGEHFNVPVTYADNKVTHICAGCAMEMIMRAAQTRCRVTAQASHTDR